MTCQVEVFPTLQCQTNHKSNERGEGSLNFTNHTTLWCSGSVNPKDNELHTRQYDELLTQSHELHNLIIKKDLWEEPTLHNSLLINASDRQSVSALTSKSYLAVNVTSDSERCDVAL